MKISHYCITENYLVCPLYKYCVARLNDPSIVGCGLSLYLAGVISPDDIGVIHEIKGGYNEAEVLQQ